ncbi:zinc finger CCCH domain-containing protein 24-like [Silene latifolia]|uniref:zinc finger CCCH domain-containing protein 24-like n=1 Tax=Silene latifolia TaxID=37657 RepID=UPI003D772F3A
MCVVPKKAESDFSLIFDVEMDDSSETKASFSCLLEFAAENDVEQFKEYIESNPNAVDEAGLWYSRQAGAKGMVLEYRTPLMVAAMYGSLDVMKTILMVSEEDVNVTCGTDKTTALHCAACGGSLNAVKLLLENSADVNLVDSKGNRPYDVMAVSRSHPEARVSLEELLVDSSDTKDSGVSGNGFGLKVAPLTIPSLEEGKSPVALKCNDNNSPRVSEKKEYPVDPSLPDIKNSIYTTDEFRMYSFKIRPCSRAYSHDWTECPFVHPGENARRRDPRKYHYSCVPCPEFRKGACRRGDMCEYAHGVFECWLHPAQYRTRLCKDGPGCIRRVCFFAHLPEELRPLYASTGSAVPSPRSVASAAAVMDMAAALNMFPVSPSGASAMSPSPFTPPMSPSGNGSSGWQPQNIPSLHLPGSNIQANSLQASRLRSSLNARDFPVEDMSCFSQPQYNSPTARSRSLAPSNLDELFSADMSSPRYSHKSAAMMNHFQHQQSMLSPINTKVFSPRPMDHPMMQPTFGPSSPSMMSPRGIDPHSPLNARLAALALHEKHQQMRSLSARELTPENGSWTRWESGNGRPDWSVNGDELTRLKRSYSIGHDGDEPDLSWVQSLVKDPPSDGKDAQTNVVSGPNPCGDDSNHSNSQIEAVDHTTLGAWLDQIAAQ